jgi:hypothetical protein
MVPIDWRLVDDLAQLQLLHAGQGLAKQVVHGGEVHQRRIQPRLKVMSVHSGDCPPGPFQLELPAQTELRVQPPIFHDHRSSSASSV